MQIIVKTAKKEKTHVCDLAVDIISEGSVMLQLRGDNRKLSKIAADFEDSLEITAEDGRSWAGYGDVIVAYRVDEDTVQVRIKRSEGA